MSYRCGIGPGLAALGMEPGEPRVTCDGCGLRTGVTKASGMPYAWFLNRKGPPGWKSTRTADGATSHDLCPRCKDGSVRETEPKP